MPVNGYSYGASLGQHEAVVQVPRGCTEACVRLSVAARRLDRRVCRYGLGGVSPYQKIDFRRPHDARETGREDVVQYTGECIT